MVRRVQINGGERIIVSPVARSIMPLAIAWSRTTTAAEPTGENRSLVALSDHLHRPEETERPDLADQRMAGDPVVQRLREIRSGVGPDALDHAFALDDLEVLQRHCAGYRMPGEV